MNNDTLKNFRLIGFIEGLSYLTLLFIAMPMKYYFDIPMAVKIVGMAHGVLFMLFIALQIAASQKHNFSIIQNTTFFVASLIPFGTFFTDVKLKAIKNI